MHDILIFINDTHTYLCFDKKVSEKILSVFGNKTDFSEAVIEDLNFL